MAESIDLIHLVTSIKLQTQQQSDFLDYKSVDTVVNNDLIHIESNLIFDFHLFPFWNRIKNKKSG